MANLKATLAAEAINGSVGDFDTANYLANQLGGVTVDVLNGGSRNTAEGDTYANIDRFFLTNLAGEVDRFIGSTADEIVHGFGGSNVLYGGGGDDALYATSAFNVTSAEDGRNVFNGGTGTDTMIGAEGDDRFDIAAGDATAGEIYRGNGGTDTVRLIAGGTGDTVDLTGADVLSIERFEFTTDMTLLVNSNQLVFTEMQGTAGTGEIVRIADWDVLDGTYDLAQAITMIDSGIDEVVWARGRGTGDITLTEEIIDQDSGETGYVETFVNDGANNIGVDTLVNYYNQDFQLFQTVRTNDDGLNITNIYDPVTGTTLEQQFFDLSKSGTTYDFEFRSVINDSTGALTYRITQYDNDLLEEQVFDANGDVTYQLLIDNSLDGSSFTYDSIEEFYTFNGTETVLSARNTANDSSETFALVQERFDANGDLSYTRSVRDNGLERIVGSDGDETFVATSATEVIVGRNGTDTFVFAGDIGDTYINAFDNTDPDLLDLTAYGIDSRDALEDAGAVTYDAVNGQHIIDVSLIGGDGMIYLRGTQDADLGNDDFIFL